MMRARAVLSARGASPCTGTRGSVRPHTSAVRSSYSYGGPCTCCDAAHFIGATPRALEAASALMAALDAHGRIDFDCEQRNPLLHVDYVWDRGPGRMFGVLVARLNGSSQLVSLKAFSGQLSNLWNVPGWVGPVPGLVHTDPKYRRYRELTEACSARLHALDHALQQHPQQPRRQRPRPAAVADGGGGGGRSGGGGTVDAAEAARAFLEAQRLLLRGRRKRLSHELLRSIQRSYQVRNFRGEALQLLHVYDLHQAAVRRTAAGVAGAAADASSGGGNDANAGGAADAGGSAGDADAAGRSRAAGGAGASGKPKGLRRPGGSVVRRVWRPDGVPGARLQQGASAVEAKREAAGDVEGHGPGRGQRELAFPAGTGDCCAPKLLWAAAQAGLTPLGLVEFWYGSPPNTATPQGRSLVETQRGEATRVHKQLYGACDKCEAILGSMLCGAGAAEGPAGAARLGAEAAAAAPGGRG